MAEPVVLRMLEIVADWFAAVPSSFPTVGLDLRDPTHDVVQAGKPALFILADESAGLFARESDDVLDEPLAVALCGYVHAEDDESPPAPLRRVARARERFLQTTLARLWAVDAGDSLRQRLTADAAAHAGDGCHDFVQAGFPLRDTGYGPPLGWFVIPCVARLHYREGSV